MGRIFLPSIYLVGVVELVSMPFRLRMREHNISLTAPSSDSMPNIPALQGLTLLCMGVVLLWIQFLQTAYSKTILPLAARKEFLSKPNRPFSRRSPSLLKLTPEA